MSFDFAPQTAFIFVLAFARIGTMVMLMPALGEISVSARIRLTFAVMLTFVLLPMIADSYPPLGATFASVVWAILTEVFVGLFVGATARLVMSSLQVAGTVIAFQTGLAFAQNVDPTQGIQGALVGTFLSVLAVTLIFVLDLHFLLIAAIRDSYVLFEPGNMLPLGDFVEMAVRTVSGAFKLGVQISAPFIVFGMVFYLALGVLSKLMPQVQIFFVAMPANIMLGFALFAVLMGGLMTWFLTYFEETMGQFLA
ncbi:MAG: flagellar type III secretion system protein FliR [Alphaproteobacteria bacterium]|nr:flagellar biosynthetic protein FliR [Rhodobiaceae bacterium]MBO6543406.1 flagellar type III secretion system protein FliR [Alphaproteobacteria bacterium]MBO6627522.1 flagellar type III secretion system protein FliR [Alphaproteobacteria bacterium]MDF1627165.1 flagellar biosynthetic protein FliR [Parvibaculaceae bacterium]|tara:strand:- start:154 stop:912 length:759 start_codon:yes stop_codon:yes gene_type:complete